MVLNVRKLAALDLHFPGAAGYLDRVHGRSGRVVGPRQLDHPQCSATRLSALADIVRRVSDESGHQLHLVVSARSKLGANGQWIS